LRLVSQDEQRRVAIGQASFHQARWHHQWTLPITVDEYLSKPNVMGLRPYEHFEGLPVRRDFDAERERCLDVMQLLSHRAQPVGQLSNGELRKLLIIAAQLAGPNVLLLDDPLGGLDPKARDLTRGLIVSWAKAGQTLVISSTHPEDFNELASHHLTLGGDSKHDGSIPLQPFDAIASNARANTQDEKSDLVIRLRGVRSMASIGR
jgi:ABC-type Mn2+/Zn2+ transport system ATPase subunit